VPLQLCGCEDGTKYALSEIVEVEGFTTLEAAQYRTISRFAAGFAQIGQDAGQRFMLVKTPGKESSTVVAVLSQHVQQLPATLRRSLTWDRGLEMAQHKTFTMATDMQVYFCDPQSPGQRGSNENTNGLLRQYLPKKADLSCYSQSDLDEIALRLNTRPRQTLGFRTPADKLQASVASTP
jgi:IS30 family transposase